MSSTIELFAILRALFLAILAFALAMAWTPFLSWSLFHYKIHKRIRNTGATPVYSALHATKAGTPTMGGILVWLTAAVIIGFFWLLAYLAPNMFTSLNFLSRRETWLPLAALLAAAFVGVVDDLMNVWGIGDHSGGLRMRHRVILYSIIAAVGAWWFFVKLGFNSIHIPLFGDITIGFWYVPVFFFIIVATSFSVDLTDGLDGLAGGVILIMLATYSAIAFALGRYDLMAFTSVLAGALLAFLWFNVYPARFIMGDTGAMSLGVVLGILAMLTNTALLLPIIGFVLVLESLSDIVQISSRKLFGRKVLLSAPIHHHLEASGWPEPKVVMRFWMISAVMSLLGLSIFLIDRLIQ